MVRKCTNCGSADVRRSGSPLVEARAHPFHSPYRCIDCDTRFWVVSRKARFGAAAGGVVLAGILAAVVSPGWITRHAISTGDAQANSNAAVMPSSIYGKANPSPSLDEVSKLPTGGRVLGDVWSGKSAASN